MNVINLTDPTYELAHRLTQRLGFQTTDQTITAALLLYDSIVRSYEAGHKSLIARNNYDKTVKYIDIPNILKLKDIR